MHIRSVEQLRNRPIKKAERRAGPAVALHALLFFVSLSVLLAACGKKGPPRPPEAIAPDPIEFFEARGTVDGVQLRWQAPQRDASGEPLTDLAGFVVQRNRYSKERSPDFEEIALIEVRPEDGEEQAPSRKPVSYAYEDSDVQPGSQYEYMVLPINDDGVEGRPASVLRVTFIGEASVVETFAPGAQ